MAVSAMMCSALDNQRSSCAASDPQALVIGRKYLAQVDCLPDCWQGMDEFFNQAERRLKAKSPNTKPEKK